MAVVAGDGDLHIGRQQRSLEGINLRENLVHHVNGIGSGTLGHTECHRRFQHAVATAMEHVVGRFSRGIGDGGDIAQKDRLVRKDTDHDGTHIRSITEK